MSYIWDRIEKRREPIDRVARRVVQRAKPEDLPSECFVSADSAAFLDGFNAAKKLAETDADQRHGVCRHGREQAMTENDLNMIDYFWFQKGDIERWSSWEERIPVIQATHPEILRAWGDYKIAERALSAIIKGSTPTGLKPGEKDLSDALGFYGFPPSVRVEP